MKILKTKLISPLLFAMISSSLMAQLEDNVILRAMKDELKRSMEEIKYDNHDRPFFISYGITDSKNLSVYAMLGAIVQSNEYQNRDKSVRVLVGNHEFNDESLDNNLYSETTANEIQLPLDNDYFGIRRALWTTTDVVYKGAAQKYKKHQVTLKEQNKKLSDLPHRVFAKAPVVQSIKPTIFSEVDLVALNDYCRQASSVFREFPDLESSDVLINFSYGTKYFVNSEGTVIVEPYSIGIVQCRVQGKTKNGEPIFETAEYYAKTPKEFPSMEKLTADARGLAEKLDNLRSANILDEEYSGPVLFLGPSVAQAFASTLFSQRESLIASNAIMSQNDYRPAAVAALDARLGKVIIDNSLTIKASPKLKSFKGETLIGSYEVDDEGVVPPDNLVLVEKGILKALLNDRSLSSTSQTANGHSTGPAVIEISSDKTLTPKALKDALISAAKTDGQDFALIVRTNASFGEAMSEVWKVNLDTGSEEVLRSCQVSELSLRNMRRIVGVASDQDAYTVQVGGTLASFIVPQGLLLGDIEIAPIKLPYLDEQESYVKNPLKN
ncbi:MAG TPA: metallopeptidase TldD-related protein [Chryseolinea sp.]|nr:metallopeptidase TldD-related protein [Chryseolinea sp.]